MLQSSSLKLLLIFFITTSFSSCGLLNKTNKVEEAKEVAPKEELVLQEVKEEEPQLVVPTLLEMKTTMGSIKIRLYEGTPLHQENFAKLIDQNYYDSLLFHRVIKDFMIQGGDPNSKNASVGTRLGNGGPSYTIPAEIKQEYFHKKGALCAARQGDNVNPEQRSSGSQFYFVTGAVYSEGDLKQMEDRINQQAKSGLVRKFWADPANKELADLYARCKRENKTDSINLLQTQVTKSEYAKYVPYKFTEEQIKTYTTIGGTPFLDNGYTVFGEVVEGLEVIDQIGKVATQGERPLEDVMILSIKVLE
jgi:peptidylprolyl isomerase